MVNSDLSKLLTISLYLVIVYIQCGPSFNYYEEGLASYYNDALEGRPTASGVIFSQDSFTAAHKTLPLGTEVLVTNLENEKSIWVIINDRGPFIPSRIIDLSKSAADSLDMIRDGVVSVKIETYLPKSAE